MPIKERLLADMRDAMRGKDAVRLETIRLLRAAVQRKELDDRATLDDGGVMQVIDKLRKQCRDAAEQFDRGGRADLAGKERAHIEILESYLPAGLSDDEIDALIARAIEQTGAASPRDMGKVMGALKSELQGRADMGAVSAKVKKRLG